MNKFKSLAFAFVLGIFAISCGDDDSSAPVVNIATPTASSTFAVTDTISLTGNVTEDTKLASVAITSDLGINETVTAVDSDTAHVFNYSITLDTLTTAGDYTLTVTATDDAGNVGTDDVQITVQ